MNFKTLQTRVEGLVRHGYLAPWEGNDSVAIEEAAALFVWDSLRLSARDYDHKINRSEKIALGDPLLIAAIR